MQLSDEEKEEAKKTILNVADGLKEKSFSQDEQFRAVLEVAEKIRNGEPVDEEIFRRIIVTKEAFDLFWDNFITKKQ